MGSENPSPFHLQYLSSCHNCKSLILTEKGPIFNSAAWSGGMLVKRNTPVVLVQDKLPLKETLKAIYKLQGHVYKVWVLLQRSKAWQLLAYNKTQIGNEAKNDIIVSLCLKAIG